MSQWGSTLSGAEESAIDIAVRVSGQNFVTDLQQRLTNVRGAMQVLHQQYQQNLITQREYLEQIQQLTTSEEKLAASVKLAENALKGVAREFHLSGQAGIQLAYAIDDIQYGFSAIVNNIPGIVQSLGGGAGLAGALGVVAVGLNVAHSAIKATGLDLGGMFKYSVKEAARSLDFIRDPIRDATDSLAGMKEVIAAIEEKPLKFTQDFEALRSLTAEVKVADRALRGLEALKNKRSESQQAAVESVQKGVQEGGGATNFVKAYIEIAKQNGTYGAGSDIVGKIREQQDIAAGQQGQRHDFGPLGAMARYRFDAARAEIDRLNQELRKEQELKAASLLDLTYGEASRKTLQDLVNDPRNAGAFARNQIDTDRLGGGIGAASPENMFQKERNKIRAQEKKKEDQRIEQQIRQENQAEEASIDEAQQQARDRERAANQDAEEEARTLLKRNADADKIGKQNDAAKAKADRAAATAEAKADRAAATAEAKAKAATDKAAREAPGIARSARIGGYAQDFQAITGATNNEAMEAGKRINALAEKGVDPTKAAQQVYQEMMRAILKIQVNQDMMLNINSGAIDQLQALDAMANATRGRLRGVQQNQKRPAVRGITLGMTQN